MEIAKIYSHLNGYEWLMHHKKTLWNEIESTINSINAEKCRTKKSKEKGMKGKLLYSPKELNKEFQAKLEDLNWEKRRFSYWVTEDERLIRNTLPLTSTEQKEIIEEAGKNPIFSYNETDFVKNRVAIEVQMGKYSFIAYDLFVKHLSFYVGDEIDLGIEILPMKEMQGQMSSGPGYFEKGLYDLVRQGRGVPAVPLILIGIIP